MLFALHDDDGKIHQANKVYISTSDQRKHVSLMRDLGHRFVAVNAPGLLSPDQWYVDIKQRSRGQRLTELKERQTMPTTAFANVIKAGTNAVLLNVPNGATITISAAGAEIRFVPKLDGDELEFPLESVPCKYKAVVRKWPYRDCTVEIEVVA